MTKRQFFIRYAWGEAPLLALLLVLTCGATAAILVSPQLVRLFLDQAQASASLAALVRTATRYVLLALLAQALTLARTYVGELIAWRSTNRLREDMAEHCLKLDMDFHKTHKPGELMERLDNDVNETRGFFSTLFTELGSTALLFFGVIGFLWAEDWRLGASALTVTALIVAVFPRINRARLPHMTRVREVHARLSGDLQEWVQGREDIQASSSVDVMLGRLEKRYGERYQASMKLLPVNTLSNVLPGLVLFLAYALAYTLSSGLAGAALGVSSFAMVLLYIGKLEMPIHMIQNSFMWMSAAEASFDRIAELLGERPALKTGTLRIEPHGGLGLSIRDLSFAYDDREVLSGINLELAPGEQLGLLGRTGSGKTTLTRLIMHLYEPRSGSVSLVTDSGSFEPAELEPACLNRLVAMVTQEVELLSATVRDNLTLYDRDISDEAVLRAMEAVSMTDWLWRQGAGLDTKMNGTQGLSAGEAQLLALARVFLRDPALVILDEASSRLDPATERKMQKAVAALLKGRSAVIIAHRLDTVRRVDRIAILEDGRVLEQGSRAELEADPDSSYRALLRTGMEEALA